MHPARQQIYKPIRGTQINWAHPLAKGLKARWLMNEGSGNKIFDLCGNGNDGIISGPNWAPGNVGSCLQFGANDIVNTGLISNYTEITVSIWMNVTSLINGGRLIDKENEYILFLSDGAEYVGGYGDISVSLLANRAGDDGQWYTPSGSYSYGNWHHVCVTYDATSTSNNPNMYIDGVAQVIDERNTPTGAKSTNSDDFTIGNRDALDRDFNPGFLDDISIYNRVLSDTEVEWLFRKPYAIFQQNRARWAVTAVPAAAITVLAAAYLNKRRKSQEGSYIPGLP